MYYSSKHMVDQVLLIFSWKYDFLFFLSYIHLFASAKYICWAVVSKEQKILFVSIKTVVLLFIPRGPNKACDTLEHWLN